MYEIMGDFHIHTVYSHDSIITPKTLVKVAAKKGIGCIAVTDHESIYGAFEVSKVVKECKLDLMVVIGMEVKTELGDIIGLFINEEIKSRNFEEVCDEIKSQGGAVVLPHPFRNTREVQVDLKRIDLVEVLNSRNTKESNFLARTLVRDGVNPIAGSDAHTPREIGYALTVVRLRGGEFSEEEIMRSLLKGNVEIVGSELPTYLNLASRVISTYKGRGLTGLLRAIGKKAVRRIKT